MNSSKKCYACKGVHTVHNEQIECYRTHGLLIEASQIGMPVARKAIIVDPNRVFVVTCGWGKDAHKWETTKSEAVQYKACPDHR